MPPSYIDIDYTVESPAQLNRLLRNCEARYHLNEDLDLVRGNRYRIRVAQSVKDQWRKEWPDRFVIEIMEDIKRTEHPAPRRNDLAVLGGTPCGHKPKSYLFGLLPSSRCVDAECENYYAESLRGLLEKLEQNQ